MRRIRVMFGMLGLLWAVALPASAQKQIKIFGVTYNVVSQSRAQTFKNGVAIHLDPGLSGVNNYAGIYFAEGPDIATDRLWFACRIDGNDADPQPTGDQLYYLEGSDAGGNFSAAVSSAKSFFGGNTDKEHGGRMISVIELNREDTGVKKDRNVLTCNFWNDDSFRLFDLDSMNSDRITDALFRRRLPSQAASAGDSSDEDGDEHIPWGAFPSFAHLPTPDGHTVLIAAGPGNDGELGIGIWDTRKDAAYDALSNVTDQTKDATKPFPAQDADGNNLNCNCMARYGDQGEYWFLLDNPAPGGGDDSERTAIILVRAKLDVPADPSKAKPGDLKVTVLDTQDIKATAGDILFPAGTAGMVSIAVGRPVSAGGPRMLYTTDYDGNFYTLTPQP
jgi:hypothetical protein